MGRAGVTHLILFDGGDQVESWGVHSGAGLLEHADQAAVDLSQQLSWLGSGAVKVLDQGAKHGGNEGGPHVVAHDVADKHADSSRRNLDDIEEIAADGPAGHVEGEELEAAVTRGAAEGATDVLLGQHGQLEFMRHLELLFHLLIFLAQLVCALRNQEFGALTVSNVPGNTKSADDVPALVAHR